MVKILKKKFKSFQHLYCEFVIKEFKMLPTSFIFEDDEKIRKRLDDILAIIFLIILQFLDKVIIKSF